MSVGSTTVQELFTAGGFEMVTRFGTGKIELEVLFYNSGVEFIVDAA